MKTIAELIGFREVYSVQCTSTVIDVVEYLCDKGVGAVIVCDGDELVGVFSERDLMHRVVHQGLDAHSITVQQVMTKDPVCVSLEDRCHDAKAMMFDKNFRHLVVVDDENQFRGFVSMRELLEADLADSKNLIRKLNDDYYHEAFLEPSKRR